MSHKTKKQKILAKLHRKLESSVVTEPIVRNQQVTFQIPVTTTTRDVPQPTGGYDYLKFGLLKTLTFTVLAITGMIVLWYLRFK